jgi:hypothetical protein
MGKSPQEPTTAQSLGALRAKKGERINAKC